MTVQSVIFINLIVSSQISFYSSKVQLCFKFELSKKVNRLSLRNSKYGKTKTTVKTRVLRQFGVLTSEDVNPNYPKAVNKRSKQTHDVINKV